MRFGWLLGMCLALVSLGAAAKECSVVPVSFEFSAEWECFVDDPEPSDIFARDGRIFLKKDGEEIALTAGPRDREPVLWPDREGFYFFSDEEGGDQYDTFRQLRSQRIDSSDARKLGEPDRSSGRLAFSRDEKSLYFWASTNGNHGSVFRVDHVTKQVSFFAYAITYFLPMNCHSPITDDLLDTVIVTLPYYGVFSPRGEDAIMVVDPDGTRRGTDTYEGIGMFCR